MARKKVEVQEDNKAVKEQTPAFDGKEEGIKYRVDFESWEAYNKYRGKKG